MANISETNFSFWERKKKNKKALEDNQSLL